MNPVQSAVKKYKIKVSLCNSHSAANIFLPFLLAACGGGTGSSQREIIGFPSSYRPPDSNYDSPKTPDPYAEKLYSPYIEPYWVSALEMSRPEEHISPLLVNYERVVNFTFPNEIPSYDHFSVVGWQPATDMIEIAARNILTEIDRVLDISIIESTDPFANNVIAIGRSDQEDSAGYSFFPNLYYELGMDVFIAKDFSNPYFISENNTNYDYEVLVHELGHALGLKHPFEAVGTNTSVLSSYEDNTSNTAMSYNHSLSTFSGTLRTLDWMALTKLYGVKSTYKAGDDIYNFSSSGGTFIIDGAGLDTIEVVGSRDVTIDLRPGMQSHVGNKSTYITEVNQLTISHGSNIENAETDSGDDIVIGNNLSNLIITGAGDDKIYSGMGSDVIFAGSGINQIDLSEEIQGTDVVRLDAVFDQSDYDIIYGFAQGVDGDVLQVSNVLSSELEFFPLVVAGNAPFANCGNGILRVIGDDLSTSSGVLAAFEDNDRLGSLSISSGSSTLIISSSSQDTGVDQSIFYAEGHSEMITLTQLALLQGNALDIDQWHSDNFSLIL